MKRIVVGLDGSPPSFGALRWSAALASTLDLDLVAAWAWLPGTVELDPAAAGALSEAAERGLDAWCAAAHPAVTPELVMIQGDVARSPLALAAVEVVVDRDVHPAAAIARALLAHEGALAVVGARHVGGLAGLRRGPAAAPARAAGRRARGRRSR